MINKFLLFVLMFFFANTAFCREVTLSSFLKSSLQNTTNSTLFDILETYSDAKQEYDEYVASYGLSAKYSYSFAAGRDLERISTSSFNSENSASISFEKNFPFFFGEDLELTYSHSLSELERAYDNIKPVSTKLEVSYKLPLSVEKIQSNEYIYDQSLRTYESAKLSYISETESYMQELISDYVEFIDARDTFDRAKKRYKNQEKVLKVAQAKYELGQISGIEMVRAKVSMMGEKSNFSESMNEYKDRKRDIFKSMGVDYSIDLHFSAVLDLEFQKLKVDQYLERLRYVKDYQKSIREIEKAEVDYLDSLVGTVPELSLKANTERMQNDTGGYNDKDSNFRYSFSLSIPLIDTGVDKVNFEAERESYRKAKDKFKETVKDVRYNIIDKFNAVTKFQEQQSILDVYLKYASDEYNIIIEQYDEGKASIQEVDNALQSYEYVSRQFFSNKKSLIIAMFELNTYVGLLTPTEKFIRVK